MICARFARSIFGARHAGDQLSPGPIETA